MVLSFIVSMILANNLMSRAWPRRPVRAGDGQNTIDPLSPLRNKAIQRKPATDLSERHQNTIPPTIQPTQNSGAPTSADYLPCFRQALDQGGDLFHRKRRRLGQGGSAANMGGGLTIARWEEKSPFLHIS